MFEGELDESCSFVGRRFLFETDFRVYGCQSTADGYTAVYLVHGSGFSYSSNVAFEGLGLFGICVALCVSTAK